MTSAVMALCCIVPPGGWGSNQQVFVLVGIRRAFGGMGMRRIAQCTVGMSCGGERWSWFVLWVVLKNPFQRRDHRLEFFVLGVVGGNEVCKV